MQSVVDRTQLNQPKFKKGAKQVNFNNTSSLDALSEMKIKHYTREELAPVRQTLPIYEYRDALIHAVEVNQNVIVVGETGSGKTTQVPQYLYEAGLISHDPEQYECIAITQPRRVAAMTLAERVSQEVGCELGGTVGYTIRFDDKSSPQTKLKFLTDGMLLREIQIDPKLNRYKIIVLDEAHERTLNTDILFGLLKKLQKEYRPDLKLVVMSATLDAEKFSKYLDAPVALIPGRTHPVDVFYIDKEANERVNKHKINLSDFNDLVVATVLQLHQEKPLDGDILCFMSGSDEIQSVKEQLTIYNRDLQEFWKLKQKKKGERLIKLKAITDAERARVADSSEDESPNDIPFDDEELMSLSDQPPPELCILPLYSTLAPEHQMLAFAPAPLGQRKVILSTNIAETSVTVSGVKYVIDTGLHKQKDYAHGSGIGTLQNHIISKAEAQQRTGRAGREQPGECYRLYTEEAFEKDFAQTPVPEIARSSLSSAVLTLKSLNIDDIYAFSLIDSPSKLAIDSALKELLYFNAIDVSGKMTELGRIMCSFPIEPVFSRMLILSARPELLFLTHTSASNQPQNDSFNQTGKLSNKKQQIQAFEKSKKLLALISLDDIKRSLGVGDDESIDLSLLYTPCSEEMCIVIAALSVDNLVVQIAQTQSQNALRLKVEQLQREYYSSYGDMFFYYNILKTFLALRNNDERIKWCKKYYFNYRNLAHAMNVYQQLCSMVLSCDLPLVSSVQLIKPKLAFIYAQFLRNKQNQLLQSNVDPSIDKRLHTTLITDYLAQNPPSIHETMGTNGIGVYDESDGEGDSKEAKTSTEFKQIGNKDKTQDFNDKKYWEVNIAKCLTAGLFRNLCYMNLEGHHVDFLEQKRVYIHPTSVLNYFVQVERREWRDIAQNNKNNNGTYGGAIVRDKASQTFGKTPQGTAGSSAGAANAQQAPKSFREYTKYATLLFYELLITKQRYIRGALRINQDWLQIYGRLFYQQETTAYLAFHATKEIQKTKTPMQHDKDDTGVNNSFFGGRSAFSNLTGQSLAHSVGLGSGEKARDIKRKTVDQQGNAVTDANTVIFDNTKKHKPNNNISKHKDKMVQLKTSTPKPNGVFINNQQANPAQDKYGFLNQNVSQQKRKSFSARQ